jgi:hypothetical protein
MTSVVEYIKKGNPTEGGPETGYRSQNYKNKSNEFEFLTLAHPNEATLSNKITSKFRDEMRIDNKTVEWGSELTTPTTWKWPESLYVSYNAESQPFKVSSIPPKNGGSRVGKKTAPTRHAINTSKTSTWTRTNRKVQVTSGRGKTATTTTKTVYKNLKTGEQRVRKMVVRNGEKKATYVKF